MSFAEIARWLCAQGVQFKTRVPGVLVPPNDKSVAKHTYNPMLKGVREQTGENHAE